MSEGRLATYAHGCNAVRVGHREALGAMSRRAQLLPLVVGCASGALVQGAAAPGGGDDRRGVLQQFGGMDAVPSGD